MRILRIIVVVVSSVILVMGTIFYFTNLGKNTAPVISCSAGDVIEASVNTTDQELLQYVTASDEQDGDITNKIKVVRKNYFVLPKTIMVTYAVCDNDNNFATYKQKVLFSDYKPPEIQLTNDLMMPSGYHYNLSLYVKANDIIDGDITQYVKLISSNFSNSEGRYPVNIKVSNSMADSTEITLDAIVTPKDYADLKIKLTKYIEYMKVGEQPDYKQYIKSITNRTQKNYSLDQIQIDTSFVDASKPGVYDVYYTIGAVDGNIEEAVTVTRLVVVVSEV